MIISHNLGAMTTSRQLGIHNKKQSKSSEKLSSGYKVNIAADGAAELTISEKMRTQIRGLNKASQNIQDGVSLIQVADGALNETHAVLQRIRELAVQAANDTNTDSDRAALQSEIDALTEEVDRIANTTTFNEDIYPLAGGKAGTITVDSPFLLDGNVTQHTYTITNMATDGLPQTWNGVEYQYGETATLTALNFYNPDTGIASHQLDNTGSYHSGGLPPTSGTNVGHYYDGAYDLKLSDLKTDADGYVYFTSKQNGTNYYFYLASWHDDIVYTTSSLNSTDRFLMNPNAPNANGDIWIQMGANRGQGDFIDMVDATANGIGLTNIDVSSHTSASNAITNVDNAISKVSEYRSKLGAQQNRLEHAKLNAENTAENTQAAESRLRDTNMADEMVEYAKTNILMQAGHSVLAQATQSVQGVLTLLQ